MKTKNLYTAFYGAGVKLAAAALSLAFMLPLAVACDADRGDNDKTEPGQTTEEITTPQQIEPTVYSLEGKTFVFLGSSVTYGSANNGVSFAEYIAERNNCTCKKYAVSGTTLVDNGSDSYVQRLINAAKRQKDCDHFICQLSTNDASQNKPLGKVSGSKDMSGFNTSTVIGAMEYIIAFAKDKWNCPVSFYTGTYYDSAAYQKMVDALYELRDKWDIGIIDLWNDEEMRSVSQTAYRRYMSDSIHPTGKGYLEWWTPKFEAYLKQFE